MLTERETSDLADRVVWGAEAAYAAALTNALIDGFMDLGVADPGAAAALSAMAARTRQNVETLLMEHKGAISAEIMAEVTEALTAADARTAEQLARLNHASPASADVHARTIAEQTAVGIREMVERQNIALAEAAERLWYEVAAEGIEHANNGTMPKGWIERAVTRLAEGGVTSVDYRSGVSSKVDVAIKRHLRTQVNQAAGRMEHDRLTACGWQFVQTTAHFGARPDHSVWQGKAFSMQGACDVDGVHYPDFYSATGYGTVTGLCGANCRHRYGIHVPGLSKLPELPDEINGMTGDEFYAATQRQRELERRVRKTKREISALERAGLGLESPTYVQKRLVLGRQQAALRSHCEQKGLVRQYAREKAYGVGAQPRALRSYAYWSGGKRSTYALSDLADFEKKHRGHAGDEVGEVFALDGTHLMDLTSNAKTGKIVFRRPRDSKWNQLEVAHTHPDSYGGTFSMQDIYFVTDSGVHALYAVCREGTYAIAPGQKPKARSFMNEYDKAYQTSVKESFGSADRTDRVRRDMHAWLSENAGDYGFDYTFKAV